MNLIPLFLGLFLIVWVIVGTFKQIRGNKKVSEEKERPESKDRQIIMTSKPKDFSITLFMEPNSTKFPDEIPENLEEVDIIHENGRLGVGYIFLSGKDFSDTHVQKDFQDLTGKQLLTLKYSLKVVLDHIDGFLIDKRETENLLKEISDGTEEKGD